jgi:uncharacterized membrane protein
VHQKTTGFFEMIYIIVTAIVGAGLVTGLLFAFSNFVMRALAELSNNNGMFAMQQINKKIINPIFILLFLGTPVLCIILVASTVTDLETSGNAFLFIGAICYLVGPFGITMRFNVPLNNRLAKAELSNADEIWIDYQVRWQLWNHIRTYIGVLSIILLTIGLGNIED